MSNPIWGSQIPHWAALRDAHRVDVGRWVEGFTETYFHNRFNRNRSSRRAVSCEQVLIDFSDWPAVGWWPIFSAFWLRYALWEAYGKTRSAPNGTIFFHTGSLERVGLRRLFGLLFVFILSTERPSFIFA